LPGQVHISLSIPEILEIIMLDEAGLSFEGTGPEGRFQAPQNIRFKVLTNAQNWRVIAVTDNLNSSSGEIPGDRIYWERYNEFGQLTAQGDLADENIVLQSGMDYTSPDEIFRLNFSVDVTMADVAGSYRGNISLQGITGD
jgi:hypothetical protein